MERGVPARPDASDGRDNTARDGRGGSSGREQLPLLSRAHDAETGRYPVDNALVLVVVDGRAGRRREATRKGRGRYRERQEQQQEQGENASVTHASYRPGAA